MLVGKTKTKEKIQMSCKQTLIRGTNAATIIAKACITSKWLLLIGMDIESLSYRIIKTYEKLRKELSEMGSNKYFVRRDNNSTHKDTNTTLRWCRIVQIWCNYDVIFILLIYWHLFFDNLIFKGDAKCDACARKTVCVQDFLFLFFCCSEANLQCYNPIL